MTGRIAGANPQVPLRQAIDCPRFCLAGFGTLPRSRSASDTPVEHVAPGTPIDRSARLALFVFGAVVVIAFPVLVKLGHYRWFYNDEWDFLAGRDGGSLHDLLRPHNEHWSTLPILTYRVLWHLVGLRSYTPYLALNITLHLTAAVLLRIVMRRAGVGPWIATSAAAVLVLFGAGSQNITFAFQIGFVGALVLGLTQLLLADHDGPIDRRDWLGLLAGIAGLLCSGVAVTMAVVVGFATLARRDWRAAVFHTAPIGVIYALWWFRFARDEYANFNSPIGPVLRFVIVGTGAAFHAMGQLPGAGVALGALLVLGLALAWGPLRGTALRHRAAMPGALLVGAFVFLLVTASGRATVLGPDFARSSRYIYLVAALSLPAIAVAADAVVRRWQLLAPAVLALLLIGIPGNVRELVYQRRREAGSFREARVLMLSFPRVSIARKLPAWVRPNPRGADEYVTLGWLLDGVASGRIPRPPPVSAEARARIEKLLAGQYYRQSFVRECRQSKECVRQLREAIVRARSGASRK
jgi:hypothetical protein